MPLGKSIERQLPLLVGGVLAAGILATAVAAYVQLGRFAVTTSGDRLLVQSTAWAERMSVAMRQRLAQLREYSDHADLAAVLRSPGPEEKATAIAVIKRLMTGSTSALEIRDDQHRVLVTIAADPAEALPPAQPWGEGVSEFQAADPRLSFAVVVRLGSEGYLVERRRLGEARSRDTIGKLLSDAGMRLLLGNASGDLWTDLSQVAPAPPIDVLASGRKHAVEYSRGSEDRLGVFAPVPQTPWLVAIEMDRDYVYAPVRSALTPLITFVSGLLIVGCGLVWFASRRLTGPLRDLTRAADAIAGGDLDRRVEVQRHDEIGRLGDAFNVMAGRVAEARGVLEAKVEDRTRQIHDGLARLEEINASLRREMDEKQRAEGEVRQLNAALSRQVSELAQVNAELDSFSYSVSHDLRAPLRAITGFSSILLQDFGERLDAEMRRYLENIDRSGERMRLLIDDLLAFSRLARKPLECESVDLDALVADVWAEIASERAGRDVQFIASPLPRCHGDPGLLRQVFANLLSNALKYSRARSTAVIEVGTAAENGETVCFVSDNGAGFDMRYAHKLFGVFQRLHREDEFEGTGVGLALVHRILTRHGFRIRAEGAVNEGARFTFTLGLPAETERLSPAVGSDRSS